ncbi:MAG: hypothetical protein ACOZBL_05110 [Patescibacteria group bacterium]
MSYLKGLANIHIIHQIFHLKGRSGPHQFNQYQVDQILVLIISPVHFI